MDSDVEQFFGRRIPDVDGVTVDGREASRVELIDGEAIGTEVRVGGAKRAHAQ